MKTDSPAYQVAYAIGYEIGFAFYAIAALVSFAMFPFPRQ